jgi:hypothetical protein
MATPAAARPRIRKSGRGGATGVTSRFRAAIPT